MSKALPEVSLAEIAKPISRSVEVIPGQSYRTIGVKWWGEGAYERQTIDGSGTAARTLSLVRQGDLIINKIWVRHGSTAIAGADVDGCAASGEFPTFTLDESRVAPRWLHWQTKTRGFWAKCDALSQGTSGKNRIKPELFMTIRVPLPPLVEQRRVVARIEELAAQIHEARTLRHQAAEETEALGKAGGNASFIEAKKRFGSKRLEDLTTRITKGESPEWQGFTYQETGPYFIRSQNVLWGSLDPRDAVHIPEAFHAKLSRSQLRKDDVLINLVGASIGRACSVPAGLGDANVNQAVGVISLKQEYLLPIFLVHFLLSPIAQDEIHGGKVETARPNISLGDVRDLEIPTPPLAEQRRIVTELDALQAEVDALKRLQAETAAELDALLPALLDRAFKGEL